MKTQMKILFFTLILLFVAPFLIAQKGEMPISTSSKEALKFFKEGRVKLENFETSPAAELFDKAINLDSDFAMAYLLRSQSGGGYAIWKQNYDKAIELIDKATEGEKIRILYTQSAVNGDGEKRVEYLNKLLKLFPSDKRINNLAGTYYYSINDYKKAITYYNKAVKADKDYAPAYNMIGYSHLALNNYDDAEKAFQTYIKLIPDKAAGYDSYAELLLKKGDYDQSIIQYKKGLEIDPVFSYSLVGLGNNYIFKEMFDDARKYYQKYYDNSKNINGKFAALFWKAISFVHERQIDKAIETFEQRRMLAEQEKNQNVAINSIANQGFILIETGRIDEGIKYYEKAIGLIENSELASSEKENFNVNAVFWRSYFLAANNDLKKAEEVCEQCRTKIEKRKNPGELMGLHNLMGYIELHKGNYDKSIELFSKADPESPVTWYYTALAYKKNKNSSKAKEMFGKIKDCNQNSLALALYRNTIPAELK